jgi:hypothetical protein
MTVLKGSVTKTESALHFRQAKIKVRRGWLVWPLDKLYCKAMIIVLGGHVSSSEY